MLRQLSRLPWPKRGRPTLAIAAVAAASAAMLPIIGASASPAPRAAGKLGPAPATGRILLLNGDRLFIRYVASGGLSSLNPAPDGGPVLTLRAGATSYKIPVDAVPYLGHGLDPNLFNVALLQRQESAGRMPVRLTFTGARRAIPGVTVTSSSGRYATGYLTATSARTFGAALYRQFRADHANASYDSAALFSGVSIALAGAPTSVPVRPQFPMHTLTVSGTNQFNKPDNGDIVLVINADDPAVFGDPIEVENIFFHGVAKYSLPAGHYWAITDFIGLLKNGLSQHLVVAPQFTVDRATKLSLSAREATSEITVRTPRPSTDMTADWTIVRTSPRGVPAISGTTSAGPVFISPTTTKPTVGTIQSYTSFQLISPPDFKGTPYAYNLDYRGPPGLIPQQHFVATAASLATVHERYYLDQRSLGAWITLGGYEAQLAGMIIVNVPAPISMPGLQTQYMTGSPSIVWQSSFFAFNGASESEGFRTLLPGQQVTENWNQYPLHPQPLAQLLSGGLADFLSTIPSAFRTGNLLWLTPAPFSDNQLGHVGGYNFGSSYQVTANGRRLGGGNFNGQVLVKVSGAPSVVKFTLQAQQPDPLSTLSPATTTEWVMHTAPAPHAVVPRSWFCLTKSGGITQHCQVEPMLTLNYQVPGLGLDAVAPAGHQQIDVSVGHIQLAANAAIAHASAQVSYDNGRFWQPVTLAGTGTGHFRVSFNAPAGVDVTIRFSATDADGNSISETVTNAYSVGQ